MCPCVLATLPLVCVRCCVLGEGWVYTKHTVYTFNQHTVDDVAAVLSEAPDRVDDVDDKHATPTTQPTSTGVHACPPAASPAQQDDAVFQPDTEAAGKVDAITRAITEQLCDVVETDDGRCTQHERAQAAAALRGALGGKVCA